MALCISPILIKKSQVYVSCGKCYNCKQNRASGWSFRLMQEAKHSINTPYFITFTYDTDNINFTPNGFLTLKKSDFQEFMGKLRSKHAIRKRKKIDANTPSGWKYKYYWYYPLGNIKYYAVGEYGSKKKRPHYHAIMFNIDLEKLVGKFYAKQIKIGNIELDGKTEIPCELWGKGMITIGQLTEASAGYTLKYISKPPSVGKFQRDDREKEFSLMSKGMGAAYLSTAIKNWHKSDLLNRFYCNLKDGKKCPMPRYYKDRIYSGYQQQKIIKNLEIKELERYQQLSPEKRDLEIKMQNSKFERLTQKNQVDSNRSDVF